MKKTFLCLSIIFIMIFCTFCAGCIDNGTVNSNNNNNMETPSIIPKLSVDEVIQLSQKPNTDTIHTFIGNYSVEVGFVIEPKSFRYTIIPNDGSSHSYLINISPRGIKEYFIGTNVITVSSYESSYIIKDDEKTPTAFWIHEYGQGLIGSIVYVDSDTFEIIKHTINEMKNGN